MNELPPDHDTLPEPKSDSSEKSPIRKAQEEYMDDIAGPSMDKSEYEQRKGQGQTNRPDDASEEAPRTPDQR